MEIEINTKDLPNIVRTLKCGDKVYLSGTVYTARDAAHKEICALLDREEPTPFPLKNAVVYYSGPTPSGNGRPVGACGPTTSSRMDGFTPRLLDLGLICMIGKGQRSPAVTEAIVRNGAVYLCAIGGAGALASRCITDCRVIAFDHLGCESVKQLTFDRFPLYVGIDPTGASIFKNEN